MWIKKIEKVIKYEELTQLALFRMIWKKWRIIENQRRNLEKVKSNLTSQRESLFSRRFYKTIKYTKIREWLETH